MKGNEIVMVCANPKCRCGFFEKPGRSIWLMQLELSGDQSAGNGAIFSASAVTEVFLAL